MKTILITGDHPRHLYFADKFAEEIISTGIDLLWVIERREAFMPTPDKDLNLNLKKLQNTKLIDLTNPKNFCVR